MATTTVLFDLDGTLLPMDQQSFVKAYFGSLARKLAPLGYESEKLFDTIWAGTRAMVKNDGSRQNEELFWDTFTDVYGQGAMEHLPYFDEFYQNDFDAVKSVCGFNAGAAKTVKRIKSAGYRVALATNPVFPAVATEHRIHWAGLDKADFELYTTYENSRYCKPNPEYYRDIAATLGVDTSECLMVGNDMAEDTAARAAGMQVFIITDCLIEREGQSLADYPHGDFEALLEFLNIK